MGRGTGQALQVLVADWRSGQRLPLRRAGAREVRRRRPLDRGLRHACGFPHRPDPQSRHRAGRRRGTGRLRARNGELRGGGALGGGERHGDADGQPPRCHRHGERWGGRERGGGCDHRACRRRDAHQGGGDRAERDHDPHLHRDGDAGAGGTRADSERRPLRALRVRAHRQRERRGGRDAHPRAFDDTGEEYGPLTLALEAHAAVQISSHDLESGNADKGLTGATGLGQGRWRLAFESGPGVRVLGYVRYRRTPGFPNPLRIRGCGSLPELETADHEGQSGLSPESNTALVRQAQRCRHHPCWGCASRLRCRCG